jgi:hypothetical protein
VEGARLEVPPDDAAGATAKAPPGVGAEGCDQSISDDELQTLLQEMQRGKRERSIPQGMSEAPEGIQIRRASYWKPHKKAGNSRKRSTLRVSVLPQPA